MNQPDRPDADALAGRFVVELDRERRTGLTAHEVAALLEGPNGGSATIYRIHRVADDGTMELVGVSSRLFSKQDCLIFSRHELKDAQSDFEAIRSAAAASAPPCRIEVQLAEVASFAPSYVIVLVFPAPCGEGVGHWLGKLDAQPGDHATGGAAALQAYQDAGKQVIDQATLEQATC